MTTPRLLPYAFTLLTLIAITLGFSSNAKADQLIVNGGFETGTFAGWTVVNGTGSFVGSNFFVNAGTVLPQSGLTTVGPASGSFYAVSDQPGAGTHSLLQTFVVSPGSGQVILSFDLL